MNHWPLIAICVLISVIRDCWPRKERQDASKSASGKVKTTKTQPTKLMETREKTRTKKAMRNVIDVGRIAAERSLVSKGLRDALTNAARKSHLGILGKDLNVVSRS
mmetsp:Transcript_10590/g.22128  ORF Transcript_10590/g.22128 Transcript_10590/m.22128 type:complete len:106 (-) Transcript_10590:43-360(-)